MKKPFQKKGREEKFRLEFPLEQPPSLLQLLILLPFLPIYLLSQLITLLGQIPLAPTPTLAKPRRRMAMYEIIRTPEGWKIMEFEVEK